MESSLTVELLSDKAVNSPKSFQCGETTLSSPCGLALSSANALLVHYNDVFDVSTKQVRDFTVTLKINPTDLQSVTWNKVSGPSSGELIDDKYAVAMYLNPKKGGVYILDSAVANSVTRTQFWLPTAGPEIEDWVIDEIAYLHTWATNYKLNTGITRKFPIIGKGLRAYDLWLFGITLDWTGYLTGQHSPCAPEQAINEYIYNPRHTICGVVIDRFHLSNLLTAYLARDMTGWTEDKLLWQFNKAGNPDDQYDVASYRIGFAVFNGGTLQQAMAAHGYDSQEPDSGNWNLKLWPSDDIPTGGNIQRPQAIQ